MSVRPGRARGWVWLVVVLAFTASCGVSPITLPSGTTVAPPRTTPATTPGTTHHPPTTTSTLPELAPLSSFPVEITWYTDIADGSPERVALETGLVAALQMGVAGPPVFRVYAYEDTARLEEAWSEVTGGTAAEAERNWEDTRAQAYFWGSWRGDDLQRADYVIFVKLEAPDREQLLRLLPGAMAHEWFHLAEYLATSARYWEVWTGAEGEAAGPEWLIEGAAEWFAATALDEAGLPADDPADWLADAPPFTLSDFEEEGTVEGAAYPTCGGVVDLLVDLAGAPAVVETYWATRVASPQSWQEVFTDVFGVAPEAFAAVVDAVVTARA